MISVISMLADPNSDSPANVDAAVSNSFHPMSLTLEICFHLCYLRSATHCSIVDICQCKNMMLPPTERVEGGPKRRVQEEGGSLCKKKSRDGVRLEVSCKFQGK